MRSSGSSACLIAAHHAKRLAVLGLQVFHLALPDAVLAGAGSLHGERALDQALDEGLARRRPRRGSSMSTSGETVEIAVADMADDRRDQPAVRRCRAGFRSTHSASREIGTHTSVANACAPGRSAHAAQ